MTTRPAAPIQTTDTVPADTPWATRLRHALLYPLRGAALAAVVALPLAHLVAALLPGIVSWIAGAAIWVSAFMYALECLRRTGNGYGAPPEVTLYANYAPGVTLLLLQVLGIVAVVLASRLYPSMWLAVILLTLLLPSLTMSLAFEDSVGAALHPATLARAAGKFGPAYLLPVAAGTLQELAYVASLRSTGFIDRQLWFALVIYLLLLNFHLMGVLLHRYHDRIGHTPEADTLAQAFGRDDDTHLLDTARNHAAQGRIDDAIDMLQRRLRDRDAADTLHGAYRQLLHQAGRTEALREHARSHIATLLQNGQPRRALGLVQASLDTDPSFMPSAPEHCAQLADAAVKSGMPRLALKLARGYPNTWPRAPQAARCGLLAATLLADHFDRPAEAGVLAAKLQRAYPDDPARADIEQLLMRLGMQGDTAS